MRSATLQALSPPGTTPSRKCCRQVGSAHVKGLQYVGSKILEGVVARWDLPSLNCCRLGGTQQGGVISSVLCNLFMHYAFDLWMSRRFPELPWCRYADDGLVHCRSLSQAQHVREALNDRFRSCGLELHEEKTHVVYTGSASELRRLNATSLDFLGFTFRIRGAKNRVENRVFDSFLPAVSDSALKRMKHPVKMALRIRHRSDLRLKQIAEFINPVVRGWFNYYGVFYSSQDQLVSATRLTG